MAARILPNHRPSDKRSTVDGHPTVALDDIYAPRSLHALTLGYIGGREFGRQWLHQGYLCHFASAPTRLRWLGIMTSEKMETNFTCPLLLLVATDQGVMMRRGLLGNRPVQCGPGAFEVISGASRATYVSYDTARNPPPSTPATGAADLAIGAIGYDQVADAACTFFIEIIAKSIMDAVVADEPGRPFQCLVQRLHQLSVLHTFFVPINRYRAPGDGKGVQMSLYICSHFWIQAAPIIEQRKDWA